MWDAILAYATLVLATIVTLATLVKDARDYLHASKRHGKWLLWSVYACALLLFIAGIFQTHQTRMQAWRDKEQARIDREHLAADQLRARMTEATNQARLDDANKSLDKLQAKVDRLQTKADTKELSKELSDVKTELEDAKSKLQQPQAKFVATFATPYYDQIPIRELRGERTTEGIKANLGVMNIGDVAAARGEIVLRLCNACQFGVEPPGFVKTSNGPEEERLRAFDTIQEHAVVQDMSVTIVPPLGDSPRFEIGIMVKCSNCEASRWDKLVVSVPPVVAPDFYKKNSRSKKKPAL
jgi:hypothetical protein